jgi:hypothetical protein
VLVADKCRIAQKMKVVRVDNVAVAQERNLHHETAVPIVVSDWISKSWLLEVLTTYGFTPPGM